MIMLCDLHVGIINGYITSISSGHPGKWCIQAVGRLANWTGTLACQNFTLYVALTKSVSKDDCYFFDIVKLGYVSGKNRRYGMFRSLNRFIVVQFFSGWMKNEKY